MKAYGHVTPYVLDAARVTKDFKYERGSRYLVEYKRMRDRYQRDLTPMTEEQKGHITTVFCICISRG